MFNEEIFNFDIDNIKNDLAIEGMAISDEDVTLFKQFANEEIDMPNLIQTIKNEIIQIKKMYVSESKAFTNIHFFYVTRLDYLWLSQ